MDKFIALLLIPGGILMIIYTKPIVDFTGRFDFAERWFLQGGTYTFIKLLGLGLAILSFMYLVGGLEAFIGSTVAPFVPGLGA